MVLSMPFSGWWNCQKWSHLRRRWRPCPCTPGLNDSKIAIDNIQYESIWPRTYADLCWVAMARKSSSGTSSNSTTRLARAPDFAKSMTSREDPSRPQRSEKWFLARTTCTGIKGHVVPDLIILVYRDLSWFISLSLKIRLLGSSLIPKIFWNSKSSVCWTHGFHNTSQPPAWQVMRFKESRHSTMALLVRSKIPTW